MNFKMVLAAEPYYYNCKGCGRVLNVPGSVEQTEQLRKHGVCTVCQPPSNKKMTMKELRRQFLRQWIS